jgi:serine protease
MRTSQDRQHAQDDEGVDGDGSSGFVILRLSRRLRSDDSDDLLEHGTNLGLVSLVDYLNGLGRPPTRRSITTVEPGELRDLEKQAMDGPLPPLNSLTRYWRIDARELLHTAEATMDEIVEGFSPLEGVELAYAEMSVREAAASTVSNPQSLGQLYLNDDDGGIYAYWAHQQPGGKGDYAHVVCVGEGWQLMHEDLVGKAPSDVITNWTTRFPSRELVNKDGFGVYVGSHGTGVMGIIAANDNAHGIIGIAPSLGSLRAASTFDKFSSENVADAVTGASKLMSPGDIIVLEVQRNGLPTETDVVDFDAIRFATSPPQRVIVIEPAGNSSRHLDNWNVPPGPMDKRRLLPGVAKWDSGAIMVGACKKPPGNKKKSKGRTTASNYGRRINCHAQGEYVRTCGGATLTSYQDLGGTSSAAAIIAGVAAVTQSRKIAATRTPLLPDGTPLLPHQMRAILSDPAAGGTDPATATGTRLPGIRSMPNLKLTTKKALAQIP